ncbi:GspE/PulE family protein [Patescibacteria group bacterium]|nr:GspE/PulE family protein [Patescibacteria group bacterium]MBU1663287.1 GspE/PulE family protein [Patescibacteria group bacterium]MBU1933847.1 GspE/PulE family protein [Patescibacteria group bacterium]MBU2007948.1 GspE/PulE family protein [Patescibacteria group bacterium]MBU2233814.1 GspE/PulE family protein [Patescibacteria group bacterium]
MSKSEELINLLIQNKLITDEQLIAIKKLPEYGKNSEEAFIKSGLVDAEDLIKLKAKVYNLNYYSLIGVKIPDQVLNLIPVEVAENYKIVCFEIAQDKMKVGIVDPENFKAIEAIDFLAKEENLQPEYFLISALSLEIALKHYKTLGKEVSIALKTKEEEDVLERASKKINQEEVEEVTKSAPVSKIVSVIIRHAVEGRASDIHIEPMQTETRIRYRIDGILHTSLILPKSVHRAIVGRIKVLANLKLDETRIPQDGRIRVNINNKEIDLRISIMPLLDEEKVVVRILDITMGAPTLEELGFMGAGLKVIKKNLVKTDGMFLITGPTGSGKSTTLFSILTDLNKEDINISTLEDPVEYFVKGANQSQVKPEIGFTFASGLRSLLRQDPDIVMVGEIRDNETAELGIHAGLTGHFVLSTLHTNDALGAIPRLLDMAVEPFLLGSTLNIVLAQRLGRKICEYCKAEYKLPENIIAEIKKELTAMPLATIKEMMPDFDFKKLKFYKGKGCVRCGGVGYKGRIALVEVLDVNDKIKEMIMSNKANFTFDDLVKNQNFITMKQDGIIKALLGLTTMEEVLRTVHV